MKRTISIIYRICYIFFSLWAFGLLLLPEGNSFPILLLSFPPVANFLGLICVIPLLIITIKGRVGKGILRFKALCTFLAFLVLLGNIDILTAPNAGDWIMCVLLPLMMVLDWLIFDKKGVLSGADPFVWLGVLAILGLLLFTVLKNVLGLANVFDIWGLFKNNTELIAFVIKALLVGALMYVLDTLLSGKSKKSLTGKIAFLWRILFLVFEGWALFTISGKNLTTFVKSLTDFTILANFLGFLCVLAVLIYNLIRYGAIFKAHSPFPRAKGIFTFAIISAFILFYFVTGGKINSILLCLICPLMMLFDWILFDKKGEFALYEPLVWLSVPLIHFVVIWAIGGFIQPQWTFLLKEFVILLITGYIMIAIDKILNR